MTTGVLATVLQMIVMAVSETSPGPATRPGLVNVALHRPYMLAPAPNYEHCTDAGDRTQLTDSVLSQGHFWTQKGTVGWSHTSAVRITIDLGTVQPVAGVSYRTAAGAAGVAWPLQIGLFVSEDGKDYHLVGDLLDLSSDHGIPEAAKYGVHTYWTDRLKTKGRFVQFAIATDGAYAFCDEIEVWRGKDEWLAEPVGGRSVGDVGEYLKASAGTQAMQRRLRTDAAEVRKAVTVCGFPAERRDEVVRQIDECVRRISDVVVSDPNALSAVVPLNELHRQILACHAPALQARGLKGLVVWQKNRWDPLGILEAPTSPPQGLPDLSIRMMRGEYRSAAFNMTMADAADALVCLKIVGAPAATDKPGRPDFVTVHRVDHVDTKQGIVVADALPELSGKADLADAVTVPAGTTRQVWLTFNPKWTAAGLYEMKIEIYNATRDGGGLKLSEAPLCMLPLRLRVEDIEFPRQPALSLGMWDYTDEPYAYGITAGNQRQAVADMREHFVDSPWGHSSVIGAPQRSHLDAAGNLKPGSIDFSRFDRWLNDWKGARRYLVFMSVGGSVAGYAMGTPEFTRVAGQWFAAWAEHCKERGLKPRQVGVLLVDEPQTDEQDRQILAWARAIKAATDFFNIWIDPIHQKLGTPDQVAMLEACDAICPNLGIYCEFGQKAESYYGRFVRDGRRELWFYLCSGPARLLDPYSYHRLQAWYCWVHGAVGMGFWAYGDTGYGNSWCEYLARSTSFCPAYIAPDHITTSKHWEAVREGVEDYEYLHMLRGRIEQLEKAGRSSPEISRAKQLLAEGPRRVAKYNPDRWFSDRDRSVADQVRLEVLEVLATLGR